MQIEKDIIEFYNSLIQKELSRLERDYIASCYYMQQEKYRTICGNYLLEYLYGDLKDELN